MYSTFIDAASYFLCCKIRRGLMVVPYISGKLKQKLAKMLKSSQSRVAKMEKEDPSVSIDLLVKSLLAMGANKKRIAKTVA